MDFNTLHPKKPPIEVIKKVPLVVHILEMFILTLIINGTKIVGKNLMM